MAVVAAAVAGALLVLQIAVVVLGSDGDDGDGQELSPLAPTGAEILLSLVGVAVLFGFVYLVLYVVNLLRIRR